MSKEVLCQQCGSTINPRRVELGYNTCVECSDERRYLGRRCDKHGDVEIFRTNLDYVEKVLRRENKVCYNANLPFNSPNSPFVNKNDMEKEWELKADMRRRKKGGDSK